MLPESHPLYEAEVFLLTLFAKAPKDHYIEFRAIIVSENMEKPGFKGKEKAVYDYTQVVSLEKSFDAVLADWAIRHNKEGYEIFFGVCPRAVVERNKNGYIKASGNDNVSHAVCAWVDMDHAKWRDILEKNPEIKPTFMVASGNGGHLYFLYKEAIEAKLASGHSKKIAEVVSGDSTHDPARLLRLPGTDNCKRWPERRPCRIEEYNPEAVFDPAMLNIEERRIGAAAAGIDTTSHEAVEAWLKSHGHNDLRTAVWFGYEHAKSYDSVEKPGDRSVIDCRIMVDLISAGANQEICRAIFFDPAYGISGKVLEAAKVGNAENYFGRTFEVALQKAEAQMARQEEVYHGAMPFITVDDLDREQPLNFCIKGLLARRGMMFVSGPAKIGKSMMVEDLILLLAGTPGKFLERFDVLSPGRVAYMQAEVSGSSLRSRLATIAEGRGANWKKTPHEIRFFNKPVDLSNFRNQASITEFLKKFQPQYLVIDPLARFHYSDENKQGDMSRLLGGIERMVREVGIYGTIIVHHHGKPQDGVERSGLASIRGSSVIGDWGNAHVILRGQRDERTDEKYIKIQFELRDAEEPRPMEVKRDKETLRYFPYSEASDTEGEARLIVTQMKGQPENDIVESLMATMGIAKERARKMLAAIKAKDRLQELQRPGEQAAQPPEVEATLEDPEVDD